MKLWWFCKVLSCLCLSLWSTVNGYLNAKSLEAQHGNHANKSTFSNKTLGHYWQNCQCTSSLHINIESKIKQACSLISRLPVTFPYISHDAIQVLVWFGKVPTILSNEYQEAPFFCLSLSHSLFYRYPILKKNPWQAICTGGPFPAWLVRSCANLCAPSQWGKCPVVLPWPPTTFRCLLKITKRSCAI